MKKLNELLASIPTSILNFITVSSGVVTLLAFVSSLVPFTLKLLGIDINTIPWLSLIKTNGFPFYSICVTCFAAAMTIKVFRYRKVQMKTRHVLSEAYYKFLHDVRNRISYFRVLEEKEDLSVRLLTEVMKQDCEAALNGLCSMYKVLSGREVSACIKLVNYDRSNNNERYVVTFARSSNSSNDRKVNDEIRTKDVITKNTDFDIIINQNKAYFYQQDLLKYKKELNKVGKEYDNTTLNWENLYRSTVVAPIRISKTRASIDNKEKQVDAQESGIAYYILGFLCVDSMYTDVFVKSEEKYYCHIIKSYAAIFYTFFKRYQEMLKLATERSTDTSTPEKPLNDSENSVDPPVISVEVKSV